jgi:antitoxin ParD1/3/4
MSKRVTIELPEDLVSYADEKVSVGEFASLDEAVAAGMRGLKDHDDFIDRWIREEVIPSYDKWVADGKPVFTEEEVCESVEAAIVAAEQRKAS